MSATFPDHFSDRAEGYAAHRPGYPAALLELLAGAAPRRGLVWEAGCGSGQLSVPLAERFRRVIGTDASPEQLARAARHPRVAYRCELAERSSLPAGSVDLAVTAQAAHWFDLGSYYGEVRRVAAPGAALALVTYGLFRVDSAVDPAVDAAVDRWRWRATGLPSAGTWRPLTGPFPFEEIETPDLEARARWRAADVVRGDVVRRPQPREGGRRGSARELPPGSPRRVGRSGEAPLRVLARGRAPR